MKIKLTWRIWLLIITLIFSLLAIFNLSAFFQKGVLITSIDINSTSYEQGLRQGQVIIGIDGKKINNLEDFSNALQGKYSFSNESVKTIITTKNSEIILFSKDAPVLTVSEISKTNIKTGLDLSGGSRALVQAKDQKLSSEEINDLVAITSNRFNVYGISDIKIFPVSDLSGNHFMLIEIAGATPSDLENLISEQGKFEAKIGNDSVFIGGERDINSVCRNDATCAGIEACQESGGGYFCNFRFSLYLSESAANKHAEITKNLGINETNPEYLSKQLDLFLDDKLVDSLFISKDLKGRVTTQIQISGSGVGQTRDDAYNSAKENMNKLQTILITGSLPYKLEIVKLDTISPLLGKEFSNSILLAGVVSILVVSLAILIRYRKIKLSLALIITSMSEIIIILGVASFIKWDLDLLSIAGILVTIGTGIDQQIIIVDEAKQSKLLSIKQKIKRAFFIILGAYFTVLVSLIPLWWAGAGLLKGFVVTTIIGITAGILITRPAFTDIVSRIEE